MRRVYFSRRRARKTDSRNTSNQAGTASSRESGHLPELPELWVLDFIRLYLSFAQKPKVEKDKAHLRGDPARRGYSSNRSGLLIQSAFFR
jgi:hypothetical protein